VFAELQNVRAADRSRRMEDEHQQERVKSQHVQLWAIKSRHPETPFDLVSVLAVIAFAPQMRPAIIGLPYRLDPYALSSGRGIIL
jgi:hypothetical protein